MRNSMATILLTMSLFLSMVGFHGAANAQSFDDAERSEIETIIQEYLLENPQIIMDAVQALRQRQEEEARLRAEAALKDNSGALTTDPNSPVGGNPDGDVTIVEFFDYRCGFCKRAHPTVMSFVENDGNIRLVYKEWPILGPESVLAARAALASREQDKYHEFHDRLMAERNITPTTIQATAIDVGLNWDQLQTDMESPIVQAHIDDTMQLAQSLGINGTPAFVIGDQLVPGAVDEAALQEIVDGYRSRQ